MSGLLFRSIFIFIARMSKVRSLENIRHKPAGGNKKIFDEKVQIAATPKVKSLEVRLIIHPDV